MKRLNNLINSPYKVAVYCLVLLAINLIFMGTLKQLWTLNKDVYQIEEKIKNSESVKKALKVKIKGLQSLESLELQALDRFNFAQQGDLVFVFTDD